MYVTPKIIIGILISNSTSLPALTLSTTNLSKWIHKSQHALVRVRNKNKLNQAIVLTSYNQAMVAESSAAESVCWECDVLLGWHLLTF